KMKQASLIIYLFDLSNETLTEVHRDINKLENLGIPFIAVGNKLDSAQPGLLKALQQIPNMLFISAGKKENLESLKDKLLEMIEADTFKNTNTIVTNVRHYDSLLQTRNALQEVLSGIDNDVTNDFLALDIRNSL